MTLWEDRLYGRVVAARVLVDQGSGLERTKKVGAVQRAALSSELIISAEVL